MNISNMLRRIILGIVGTGLFYLVLYCVPSLRYVWQLTLHIIVSLPFAISTGFLFSRIQTSDIKIALGSAVCILAGFLGGFALILGCMFVSLPYGIGDAQFYIKDETYQIVPFLCVGGIPSVIVSIMVFKAINRRVNASPNIR